MMTLLIGFHESRMGSPYESNDAYGWDKCGFRHYYFDILDLIHRTRQELEPGTDDKIVDVVHFQKEIHRQLVKYADERNNRPPIIWNTRKDRLAKEMGQFRILSKELIGSGQGSTALSRRVTPSLATFNLYEKLHLTKEIHEKIKTRRCHFFNCVIPGAKQANQFLQAVLRVMMYAVEQHIDEGYKLDKTFKLISQSLAVRLTERGDTLKSFHYMDKGDPSKTLLDSVVTKSRCKISDPKRLFLPESLKKVDANVFNRDVDINKWTYMIQHGKKQDPGTICPLYPTHQDTSDIDEKCDSDDFYGAMQSSFPKHIWTQKCIVMLVQAREAWVAAKKKLFLPDNMNPDNRTLEDHMEILQNFTCNHEFMGGIDRDSPHDYFHHCFPKK